MQKQAMNTYVVLHDSCRALFRLSVSEALLGLGVHIFVSSFLAELIFVFSYFSPLAELIIVFSYIVSSREALLGLVVGRKGAHVQGLVSSRKGPNKPPCAPFRLLHSCAACQKTLS